MKRVFVTALMLAGGMFGQIKCPTGCVMYSPDGVNFSLVQLGAGCTVSGGVLTCTNTSNNGYPSVTASVASNGTVLAFTCVNLNLLPPFASAFPASTSCPGSVVANVAPSSGPATVWVALNSVSAQLHVGVQGMSASQFTCAVPSQCVIDGNVIPVAGEYPVARGYLNKLSTGGPQWQITQWTWTAAPALPVTIPIAYGGATDTNVPFIEIASTQTQVTCTAYNK